MSVIVTSKSGAVLSNHSSVDGELIVIEGTIESIEMVQRGRRRLNCYLSDGKGFIKSPTTVCYEIFMELRRIGLKQKKPRKGCRNQ